MTATRQVQRGDQLAAALHTDAVVTETLGPGVPLMAHSPTQWIAASGMVLRARIGSEVQGMSVGGSDIDEMGVCVEPHRTVIGHHRFEHYAFRTQPDGVTSGPGDLDLIVYGLRKFVHLVTAGNPTVLMMLFLPDEHVQFQTDVGADLRARRDMFLSRQAGPKFRGYLDSQRRGLLGLRSGGSRNQGRQDIRDRYGFDVKFAAHMVRLGLQGVELLTTGAITLPIPEPDRTWLLELRRGEHTKQDALDRAAELEARIDALMADVHRAHWGWA